MKRLAILVIVLFTAIGVYVVHLPPKEMTLKDLHPVITVHTNPKEPVMQDTSDIDSTKTEGNDTVCVAYYIIIESLSNPAVAQRKAEKLRSEFSTEIIVLPRTKEGYYRISYGKYSSLEEAKAILENARKKFAPMYGSMQ